MNPSNNGETPLQLPPVEQAPAVSPGETAPRGTEAVPSGERAAQAAPALMPSTIPLPTPPIMPLAGQPATSTNSAQGNPAQASDDTDLIEKEWVDKAKQIVERTKDDPYKQTEELTVFKADYMKKRYNRTIKLK